MAKYKPKLWGYQLQNAKPKSIAKTDHDLVVIDFEQDGPRSFTSREIKLMKADGKHKIVPYISIGEAEDYRAYWKTSWSNNLPAWLEKENPDWEGNYKVRYWDTGWQKITLDRIKAMAKAGYDGAYLDIIDAYEHFASSRPSAAQDMIKFVGKIAAAARAINKKFLIIPQNGEGLLESKKYVSLIDGIAKEDLYYSLNGDGVRNPADEVAYSKKFLDIAKKAGKFVLNVEYLSSKTTVKSYLKKVSKDGYIPYVGPRDLHKLKHDVSPSWSDDRAAAQGMDASAVEPLHFAAALVPEPASVAGADPRQSIVSASGRDNPSPYHDDIPHGDPTDMPARETGADTFFFLSPDQGRPSVVETVSAPAPSPDDQGDLRPISRRLRTTKAISVPFTPTCIRRISRCAFTS